MMKFKNIKKADISTAFITIVGVFMITIVFFQNLMLSLEVEKYNILNQYTRDALLICETQPDIDLSDLAKIRKTLADRIITKNGETVDMTIQIGTNPEQRITDGSSGTLQPLFGQQIKVTVTYNYFPFRFLASGLLVKRADTTEAPQQTMGVTLLTTSKARSGVE